MKNCRNCDYYVNNYGYGQCYAQKNAPRVENNECCENWKKYLELEKTTSDAQSDLNNAIIKSITDITTVLEKQEKEIEELRKRVEDLYDMLCCEDDD